jgi:Zn-dependent protease
LDIAPQLVAFGVVLASLTVHEWAHAFTANRLGDPTARMLGRMSLNPAVHIDLVGTILLPLIAILSNFPILGWAKPVPVNMSRLSNPKRDFMIVAAAGPASNIVLAVAAAIAFRALGGAGAITPGLLDPVTMLARAVEINVLLAVFNMLPIPPLDGGNVLAGLLPDSWGALLQGLRQYGFLILYALLFTGILGQMLFPPMDFLVRFLLL